jgi:hypothetical protein
MLGQRLAAGPMGPARAKVFLDQEITCDIYGVFTLLPALLTRAPLSGVRIPP